MTFEEFDKYTEELLIKVKYMRDTKGEEYARSVDRFGNFNRLAVSMSLDRKKIWQVYFVKHVDAIYSYINNNKEFSSEGIEGRIVDAITYLTLLAGMIAENKIEEWSKVLPTFEPSSKSQRWDAAIFPHCGALGTFGFRCVLPKGHQDKRGHGAYNLKNEWISWPIDAIQDK